MDCLPLFAAILPPTYRPWAYLVLSLACAAAFLLSSRQDIRLGAKTGAIFGQIVALFILIGMTVKASLEHWWIPGVVSGIAFCVEVLLLMRWRVEKNSQRSAP